jgi:hypothetical protein
VSGACAGVGAGAASCTFVLLLVTTDFFSAQPVKIIKLDINTTRIPVKVRLFFIIVPLFPYLKNKFVKIKKLQR